MSIKTGKAKVQVQDQDIEDYLTTQDLAELLNNNYIDCRGESDNVSESSDNSVDNSIDSFDSGLENDGLNEKLNNHDYIQKDIEEFKVVDLSSDDGHDIDNDYYDQINDDQLQSYNEEYEIYREYNTQDEQFIVEEEAEIKAREMDSEADELENKNEINNYEYKAMPSDMDDETFNKLCKEADARRAKQLAKYPVNDYEYAASDFDDDDSDSDNVDEKSKDQLNNDINAINLKKDIDVKMNLMFDLFLRIERGLGIHDKFNDIKDKRRDMKRAIISHYNTILNDITKSIRELKNILDSHDFSTCLNIN
jgi:hypothetical protein